VALAFRFWIGKPAVLIEVPWNSSVPPVECLVNRLPWQYLLLLCTSTFTLHYHALITWDTKHTNRNSGMIATETPGMLLLALRAREGRSIAQAVGCLPATHPGSPGSVPGKVMWDLWRTKWHWGRFSPSISVFPANYHSTNCSAFVIRGWYNMPNSGRHTKWTQSQLNPRKRKVPDT
jgi:hypothetical protein